MKHLFKVKIISNFRLFRNSEYTSLISVYLCLHTEYVKSNHVHGYSYIYEPFSGVCFHMYCGVLLVLESLAALVAFIGLFPDVYHLMSCKDVSYM